MDSKKQKAYKIIENVDKYSYLILFLELAVAYILYISHDDKVLLKILYTWICLLGMILFKYIFYFELFLFLKLRRFKKLIVLSISLNICFFCSIIILSIFNIIFAFKSLSVIRILYGSSALSGVIRFIVKNKERIAEKH